MILYTIVNLDDVYYPERYNKLQKAENNVFSTNPYDYLLRGNLYLEKESIWRNYGTTKSNY